mmetsp:Transcript_26955/g.67764  ORF Transcript_26955/g.67764 Transcript_26955/m.67764 type:complete len:364 (+) Transcript_26955:312-1403(+)
MGDHDRPASLVCHLARLDALGDGADLVDLEEEGVAGVAVDGALNALGVGDEQIVANDLYTIGDLGGERGEGLPVVLVERILNGDDRVLGAELLVERDQLGAGLLQTAVALLVLKVEVVHVLLLEEELGGRNVHAELHLASVASTLDGLGAKGETLHVVEDVGREATLVANVGGVLTILGLDDELEVLVDLGTHAECLGERGGTNREDHELLHGELVASMAAAVDDVEGGHGQQQLVRVAGQLSDMRVERQGARGGAGAAHSQTDSQNGVGAQRALAVGAVQGEHRLIDGGLLAGVHADHGGRDAFVHVRHRFADTLAQELGLVTVAQLQRLVHAGAGTAGHGSTEHTMTGGDLNLHRRVTTAV